ncbi:MAG: polysaccharide deacetylase family protein [Rhodospirillales bacterium]|nr:polysaccharide deacetylase family protein [Rhodospirillales bacterium]
MKFKAKGQKPSSESVLVDSRSMLRSMVFGMSFAVGLTFGAGQGIAQSDMSEPQPAADTALTGAANAEAGAEASVETKINKMAPKTEPSAAPVAVMDGPTGDATSSVIFMYHRFGEDQYPSTNIKLDQFKAHVKELTDGNYTVMDVPKIVAALETGGGLPDRAIGITIDDAYRSVYQEAWPIFRANDMPFTVFVSSQQVDDGYSNYMTWDMLREMAKAGVTIGGHSQNHSHLPDLDIEAVKAELAHSAARFKEELGFVPEIFAYPYGEANADVIAAVKEAGYKAAFGQQSGAMSNESDFMYLPRFALNEHYGAMDRFTLAANSLPLRVSDITPGDYTLTRNPPAFGFTLKEPTPNIACYPSDGQATMSRLGDERVEIRLDGPVASGRWRINCTAMGAEQRWHWFGMLYTVP